MRPATSVQRSTHEARPSKTRSKVRRLIPQFPSDRCDLELAQSRRLELASALEGTTLLLLLLVAMPLKHLAGEPVAVTVLGPVHGLAFSLYVRTVVETVAGGGWTRGETARLALAALIPFGGYFNLRWLRERSRFSELEP